MKHVKCSFFRKPLATVIGATVFLVGMSTQATEPCDDFGECKVLNEINSSDGDIGIHILADADDLRAKRIYDPNGEKVIEKRAFGPLSDQLLTESYRESAEHLSWF